MSKLTVSCTDFRPLNRDTLLGFATVNIAEMRMTISDVAIHEKNGKVKYVPIFSFDAKDVERAFSNAVVRAVEDARHLAERAI